MQTNKRTLVVGATPNPSRFAYRAIHMLKEYNHDVVLFGIKKGHVANELIHNNWPVGIEIDTITLYISQKWQSPYYQNILASNAKRIIFNPGTENAELVELASKAGIECLDACTLVLLQTNQY